MTTFVTMSLLNLEKYKIAGISMGVLVVFPYSAKRYFVRKAQKRKWYIKHSAKTNSKMS